MDVQERIRSEGSSVKWQHQVELGNITQSQGFNGIWSRSSGKSITSSNNAKYDSNHQLKRVDNGSGGMLVIGCPFLVLTAQLANNYHTPASSPIPGPSKPEPEPLQLQLRISSPPTLPTLRNEVVPLSPESRFPILCTNESKLSLLEPALTYLPIAESSRRFGVSTLLETGKRRQEPTGDLVYLPKRQAFEILNSFGKAYETAQDFPYIVIAYFYMKI
ncbi:hypothetical protein BT96DRAFT_938146 [Gymnopus androsaceus JB14]|uniref:Uncharacterized protein n=1 Tax=Gymnopus androsaceus JB14 TaxID=1447944 RepID=A0A6A4HX58_9AGAR|nr:hypothetical protein BT96DRAFT_938146 [Gymnopus androsaceus JB14]